MDNRGRTDELEEDPTFFLSYHHHGGEAFFYPAGFASPAKRAMAVLFPCEFSFSFSAGERRITYHSPTLNENHPSIHSMKVNTLILSISKDCAGCEERQI